VFSIRLLPPSELGPDGQRLGEITIGGFIERFACYSSDSHVEEIELIWRKELRRLIDGAPHVALIHDPRFAWIVYRERNRCIVQHKLSLDGNFRSIPTRQTKSDDGESVSEWTTSISEIEKFLRTVECKD
jgi:hypothetical protein